MEELKQRILQDGIGKAKGNVVLVGRFINHQIDPQLTMRCAKEFERIFKGKGATRIVTIEASGIAPAVMLGYLMNLPVVFIKKNNTSLSNRGCTRSPKLTIQLFASAKSFSQKTIRSSSLMIFWQTDMRRVA